MLFCISTVIILYFTIQHQTSARHASSQFNGLDSHPNWQLLPLETCGKAGNVPTIDIKVVGGSNAYFGEFPWMANFFNTLERQVKNDHDCGGSIINKRYILSAAHCCENVSPKEAWIRVGEYDLNNDGEECRPQGCVDSVQNIAVENITIHEKYTSIFHDDICLIRLKDDVHFNEYVHPVCLPVYESLLYRSFAGEKMEVAGWGHSNEFRTNATPILQTVEIPVVSEPDCHEEYPFVGAKEICAGGVVGDDLKNFCMGDSGGPLMKEVEVVGKERYFLFGIVSHIQTTKLPGTRNMACNVVVPGVFARVTSYLDWILDNMKP